MVPSEGNKEGLVRKTVCWVSLVALLLLVAVLFARNRMSGLWERYLLGPYMGEPYKELLSGSPNSEIRLRDNLLQQYKTTDSRGPVLALRRSDGKLLWSFLLEPSENVQGKRVTWHINSITFKEVKFSKSEAKVYISCDWNHGGIENGIIYIDEYLAFKGIAIGW